MEGGAIAGLVIGLVALFIFVWYVLSHTIYIVHQGEGVVVERCGKFLTKLKTGLNYVVPVVDAPRQFVWRSSDINSFEPRTSSVIDLRESVFNLGKMDVYTKDTVLVDVTSLMYYKISDQWKAIYIVSDLISAIANTAQTQLKEVFGNMTFTQALQSQTQINRHLTQRFDVLFQRWGISVQRMELLDLNPRGGVSDFMKKEMMAERKRRGAFIHSEGDKAAMKLKADGVSQRLKNMGRAEQQATRKRSEGQAQATMAIAEADREAIATVSAAIAQTGANAIDYMLLMREYMSFFDLLVERSDQRSLFMPYDTLAASGMLPRLPLVFGAAAARNRRLPSVPRPMPIAEAPAEKEFQELDD